MHVAFGYSQFLLSTRHRRHATLRVMYRITRMRVDSFDTGTFLPSPFARFRVAPTDTLEKHKKPNLAQNQCILYILFTKLLMEEILHQLIGSLSHVFTR